MLNLSEIKTGTKIEMDGDPYLVTFNQFSKSGRQGGVMKTKIKNLKTGKVMDKTFQGSDKVERADMSFSKAQFLYQNGDAFEFMDNETFETFEMSADQLGETGNFLVDGSDVDIQNFEGQPINIQLNPKMTFEVTQTDPGVKGDTATGGTKPATLETGYIVKQVPLFINAGDKIVINTDTGEYCERAKS